MIRRPKVDLYSHERIKKFFMVKFFITFYLIKYHKYAFHNKLFLSVNSVQISALSCLESLDNKKGVHFEKKATHKKMFNS